MYKNIRVNKQVFVSKVSNDEVSKNDTKQIIACAVSFSILFGSQFLNYII